MKPINLVCPHCGEGFEGIAGAGNYPYCSSECKRQATPKAGAPKSVSAHGVNGTVSPVQTPRRHGVDRREE